MKNMDFLNELAPTEEEIREAEAEAEEEIEEEKLEEDLSDADAYQSDSFKMYLKEIGQIRLLTQEEEQTLGQLVQEGGESAEWARNRLVKANLRLAVHYAKGFRGRGVELEDLVSMGNVGLIKAAEKFDYRLGYKFSTYATWWVRQAISRGIADEAATIRIPVHMNETIYAIKKAQKKLNQENGSTPTMEEIVQETGLPEKTVEAAMKAMVNMISLDAKVGEDKDTDLADFLADGKAEDPCQAALKKDLARVIRESLEKLTPKEAEIVRLRQGIGCDHIMTLEEIAKMPQFNITRERVRQIEAKAMRKLSRDPRLRALHDNRVA